MYVTNAVNAKVTSSRTNFHAKMAGPPTFAMCFRQKGTLGASSAATSAGGVYDVHAARSLRTAFELAMA